MNNDESELVTQRDMLRRAGMFRAAHDFDMRIQAMRDARRRTSQTAPRAD